MQRSASTTLALGVLSVMWLGAGSAAAAPFGPSAYVQQSDSPFAALDFSGGYFTSRISRTTPSIRRA